MTVKGMAEKKRAVSLLIAVAVLFVMLCSVLCVASAAVHDCVGEGCPVCLRLGALRSISQYIALAVCVYVAAGLGCGSYPAATDRVRYISAHTPVCLKVKLSN